VVNRRANSRGHVKYADKINISLNSLANHFIVQNSGLNAAYTFATLLRVIFFFFFFFKINMIIFRKNLNTCNIALTMEIVYLEIYSDCQLKRYIYADFSMNYEF